MQVKHSQLVEKLVAEFKHAKGELAKKKRDELLRLYASAAVKKKQVTVPSDWRQRALSVEEVVVRSSKAATLSKGKVIACALKKAHLASFKFLLFRQIGQSERFVKSADCNLVRSFSVIIRLDDHLIIEQF